MNERDYQAEMKAVGAALETLDRAKLILKAEWTDLNKHQACQYALSQGLDIVQPMAKLDLPIKVHNRLRRSVRVETIGDLLRLVCEMGWADPIRLFGKRSAKDVITALHVQGYIDGEAAVTYLFGAQQ